VRDAAKLIVREVVTITTSGASVSLKYDGLLSSTGTSLEVLPHFYATLHLNSNKEAES
jgi:hypothetical protein